MTHNVVFLVKKYDLSHYISKKGDKTRIFFYYDSAPFRDFDKEIR